MQDYTRLVIITAGMLVAGLGFYHLATGGNLSIDTPFLGRPLRTEKEAVWPMQLGDPNIINAYDRAAYRDNTLRADELYDNNPANNFNNDFLHHYAPTVKQTNIPIQQL